MHEMEKDNGYINTQIWEKPMFSFQKSFQQLVFNYYFQVSCLNCSQVGIYILKSQYFIFSNNKIVLKKRMQNYVVPFQWIPN